MTSLIVPDSLVTPSNTRGEMDRHCKPARLTGRRLIREYIRLLVLINVKIIRVRWIDHKCKVNSNEFNTEETIYE